MASEENAITYTLFMRSKVMSDQEFFDRALIALASTKAVCPLTKEAAARLVQAAAVLTQVRGELLGNAPNKVVGDAYDQKAKQRYEVDFDRWVNDSNATSNRQFYDENPKEFQAPS